VSQTEGIGWWNGMEWIVRAVVGGAVLDARREAYFGRAGVRRVQVHFRQKAWCCADVQRLFLSECGC
jgi:hypothetical protein